MTQLGYGFFETISDTTFAEAVDRVKAALAEEGFGVIAEMDFQAILQAKLGEDFRPYVVLGACNPPLALEALREDPHIGLLLPCNVVIQQNEGGEIDVSVIHPKAIFALVRRPELAPLAEAVEARLHKVMARVSKPK